MLSREYIIERAGAMFVNEGIRAVRMDDIARALSVSKRTLYELFGDKQELLYLCLQYYLDERCRRHAALAEGSANILEALLRILNDMRDTAPVALRVRDNLLRFYPQVFRRLKEYGLRCDDFRHMRTCLEQGVREGLFDARMKTDLVIALLEHSIEGIMDPSSGVLPPGESPYKAFEHALIHFLRGISTPSGLRLIDNYLDELRLGTPASGASRNEKRETTI